VTRNPEPQRFLVSYCDKNNRVIADMEVTATGALISELEGQYARYAQRWLPEYTDIARTVVEEITPC
jgi:hypothetical protein